MRLLVRLVLAIVSLALLIPPEGQSAELKRIAYNHPGLVVDLGVGLWA